MKMSFEEDEEEYEDETTDDEGGEWILKDMERQETLKKNMDVVFLKYFSKKSLSNLDPNDPNDLISLIE